MTNEYVLHPAWTYAMRDDGPQLLRDAYVHVHGNQIINVTQLRPRTHAPEIELAGKLLLPGLISGHTHVAGGTPTRGLIEGGRRWQAPLMMVETLDDADMDALTLHNLYEIVRSGCSTLLEMSLSQRQAESYARCAARLGARGYVGPMMPGRTRLYDVWFRSDDKVLFDSEAETLREIEDARAFGRRIHDTCDGRLKYMMAPHACDTHTPATLAAIRDVMREFGTGLHIHLSQSDRETQAVERLWGKTPTQWLADLGMLDGPFFGAHMMGLRWPQDVAVLVAKQAVFAHCPSAGGAGAATQPYPEALAAGLHSNIAIDTHSNDMLENLKLAVLYGRQRARLLAPHVNTPMRAPAIEDAVAGCTHIAANGLRRADLGRVREQCLADFTIIDVSGLLAGVGTVPPEPLHHLLYSHGLAVSDVIIDGKFIIRDGTCVDHDAQEIITEGGRVLQKMWRRLDADGWFA